MPDSVEIPAPLSTTTPPAASSLAIASTRPLVPSITLPCCLTASRCSERSPTSAVQRARLPTVTPGPAGDGGADHRQDALAEVHLPCAQDVLHGHHTSSVLPRGVPEAGPGGHA